MFYEPGDHALEPRQVLAAWAVFAIALVASLGASIRQTDFYRGNYETLLAQSSVVGVTTLSEPHCEESMTINALTIARGGRCPLSASKGTNFRLGR